MGDVSKINQKELKYSCSAGEASVNLYTGRLLFEHPDMVIGAGSFQIGISHIYNSHFEGHISHDTHMGKNWKLNVQQYLVKVDNTEDSDYYYYDSMGYEHRFIRYKDEYELLPNKPANYQGPVPYEECYQKTYSYYDKTGLGLTLKVTTGLMWDTNKYADIYKAIISDEVGNEIEFASNGKLLYVRSGINSEIEKKYRYNTLGQLIEIYDTRKSLRTILFTYKNNLLYEIKCEASKEALYYTYDIFGNITTMTKKTNNITSKTVATFTYNGSNMRYAYGSDLSALQFIYTADNKINQVRNCTVSISQNYIKGQVNYVGYDIYLGEDIYVGEEEKILINCDVGVPNSYVKSTSIFTYSTNKNKTTITNEKGITFAYFFNEEGFTIGILEDTVTKGYLTMTKTSGWELNSEGASSIKINGKKANILNGSNPSYQVPIDKINDFKSIFPNNPNSTKKKHKYTDRFTVSFWAKFTTSKNNVKAKFSYGSNFNPISNRYVSETFHSFIGDVLADSWQYITIPINFDITEKDSDINASDIERIKEELDSMSLSFEGYNGEVLIADLRIAVGTTNYLMIKGDYFDNIKKIKYKEKTDAMQEELISSSFFMTEEDLFRTYKNMYHQQGLDNTKIFDMVVCSGTRMISVKEIYAVFQNSQYSHKFELDYLDSGGALPNYYTESRNRTANSKWCVTKSQLRIKDDHYEQKTAVDFVNDLDDNIDESSSSKTYIWTYNNGLLRAKKDAYEVLSFNEYDDYGNITSIEMFNDNDEESRAKERLTTTYNYGTTYPKLREQPVSVTSNGITKEYTYEDPWMMPSSTTIEDNTSDISYDTHHDKIKSIQNKNNQTGTINAQNRFMYDSNGRLKKVSDQDGRNYSFEYNIFGEATKYYEEDKLLLEKSIVRNNNFSINGKTYPNADKVTEKRYRTASTNPDISDTIIDKYGRVRSQTNNGKTTTYTYQDYSSRFTESSTLAKVESIEDPYEGQTYYYQYDEENRPFGWWASGNDETGAIDTEVRQLNQNDIEYTFHTDGSKRTSSIIREDNEVDSGKKKYIEPRIYKTIDKDDSFVSSPNDYQATYIYDHLGRQKKVIGGGSIYGAVDRVIPSTTTEYKPETTFIKKQIHNINHVNYLLGTIVDSLSINQEYEHDSRGNITVFTETGEGFKEVPKIEIPRIFGLDTTTLNKTRTYSYDSQNRLKKETYKNFNQTEYDYDYEYVVNSNKIKKVKQGSTTIKEFTYTNNKKTTYKSYSVNYPITYDNYGNVTKHLNDVITYNNRNLISKVGNTIYDYNHQGVRFTKEISSNIKVNYYLDGSRILGEDRIDSSDNTTKKLRYFYNAQGIAGLRYDGYNFNFIRDAIGNISKIMHRGKLIAEYNYDAWGNCTTSYLGTYHVRDKFVVDNNPFRWKGHYFDTESGLYYINSRYYSPELMIYLDADNPENFIENAYVINGLDRHAITTTNSVDFMVNNDNIFTSTELFPDPDYDPDKDKSWWQLNWKKAVQFIIFLVLLIVSVVLMIIPGTQAFGIGMFMNGLKFAINGFVIGGIIGGITSLIKGNKFLEGATDGAIEGLINGFNAGAIMYCVSQGIGAIANVINKAKAPSYCFISGTLVVTREGYKKIEDIEVGDEVLSYDEETGRQDYKHVLNLFRNGKLINDTRNQDIGEGVRDWINVKVSKESTKEELDLITCTFEHPFFVLNASLDRTKVIFEGSDEQTKESQGTWIAAKDLKAGDKLLLSNGENAIITSIEVEHYDEPHTTYNFEVEVSLPLLTPHRKDKITAKEDTSYNVEGKGLVNAKDVQVGDRIILESGEIAIVLSSETKTVGGPQVTYNFEVADFHTYYVGQSGTLVHNACGDDAFDVMQFDDAAIAEAKTPLVNSKGVSRDPSFSTFKRKLFAAQERLHPGTFAEGTTNIINGQKVILHHPLGRAGANLYNVVGVTQSQHLAIHAITGYKNAVWSAVNYSLGSGVF